MLDTLLVVAVIATLAPLVAALLSRAVRLPVVVVEIVLGLLAGPAVFGVVSDLTLLERIAEIGLVMLFFMAGTEIDFREIGGRPLRRSLVGWVISVVAGIGIGTALAGSFPSGVYLGIAVSSTALGTLIPVLIDSGRLRSPFGVSVSALGAVGEFGPLVAISVFLSSREPALSAVVLVGFVAVALGAIVLAARGDHKRLHGLIAATLHTSGQFAVRLVILLVFALVALSLVLGLDLLLGAFASGVLVQYLLVSAPREEAEQVRSKLDAVAFGVLVPIFFISTGITFDLRALLEEPGALALAGAFVLVLLVVRGLPGMLSAPRGATGAERRAIGLMAATELPILVAVMGIALDDNALSRGTATALIGAGMVSVLLFPMLAGIQLGTPAATTSDAAADDATW